MENRKSSGKAKLTAPIFSTEPLIKKPRLKVSVIVPVYHGLDTIEKCIRSILQQKFRDFELIVIDDGSKDGSSIVVTRLLNDSAAAHNVLVHARNLGIAATLNEGIRLSQGEYMLIVHQDCELCDSAYLEKAVGFLDRNSDVAAMCGKPLYPDTEFGFHEKVFMIWSGHFSKAPQPSIEEVSFAEHKCDLFKRDILLKVGGFDSAHFRASGEDQMTSWQIRNLGYRILRSSELKYVQRYGKSLTTLRGLLKRVFKYGKTQSGIILLTRGKCVARQGRTSDQTTRLRNRLTGALCSTFFASSWVAFLLNNNILFVGLGLTFFLARVLQLSLRARQYDLRMSSDSIVAASLTGFLADIIYSIGLLYGTFLASAGRKL